MLEFAAARRFTCAASLVVCILLQAKVPNTSDWFAAYGKLSRLPNV